MYINTLGAARTASHTYRNNSVQTSNTDSYAAAMKTALAKQNTSVRPTSAWAGDIIIREALEKMKSDPEWEEAVMDKIQEAAQTDYPLTGQSGLQGYLMQELISGGSNAGLLNYMTARQGLSGYSPYNMNLSGYPYTGLGSLVTAAYGNVMNDTYNNTSLLGNWML